MNDTYGVYGLGYDDKDNITDYAKIFIECATFNEAAGMYEKVMSGEEKFNFPEGVERLCVQFEKEIVDEEVEVLGCFWITKGV